MKFSLFSEETINQFLQRYLEAGKWTKAADMYKKLIDLHPENTNFRLRLAEMYTKSGDRKEALEEYQKVAEDFVHMNNLDKAITIYRTILSLDASLSHIRIQLADVYAMQGKTDEVWTQYMAALKYMEEKNLTNQAISILENMSKQKFEDVKLMTQLAEMFLSRNLKTQAINQFLAIAEFQMEKQQYGEAVKYYKKVMELDPRNREASFGLVVLERTAPSAVEESKAQEPAAEDKPEPEVPKPQSAPVQNSAPTLTSSPKPAKSQNKPESPKPQPVPVQKPAPAMAPPPEPALPQNKPEPRLIKPTMAVSPVATSQPKKLEPIISSVQPAPSVPAAPATPAPQPIPATPVSQPVQVDLEAAVHEDLDLELLFSEDKLETLLEKITNGGCQDETAAEEHYGLGLMYQTLSLWDAAIEEFMQAACDKGLEEKCFRSVGECYKQKGMPRHAQKYQHMALEGYAI